MDRGLLQPNADDLRAAGSPRAARRPAGAAAVLEQLPRPGRSPARARGGVRGGDAVRRRRGRLAAHSGNMPPPRRLEVRLAAVRGDRGRAAVRHRLPREPGRGAGLARKGEVVFSDELNHASLWTAAASRRGDVRVPPRRRGAPRRVLQQADGRAAADRHRRRLHHGWRHRAAGGDREARPPTTAGLLLLDQAHATGASAPTGAARSRRRGVEDEVDVVAARSARRSAPTAPTCAAPSRCPSSW